MKRITVRDLERKTAPGRYPAGPCLYLAVGRTPGQRSWIVRTTVNGQRVERGIGSCKWITLQEARDAAADFVRSVKRGEPVAERSTVPTFQHCADRAFEANAKTWTAKTCATWRSALANYCQVLMPRRVDGITAADVLGILVPVYETKPAIGRKVRNAIRLTLGWAEAHSHVDRNAAGEAIDAGLPKTAAVKEHRKALPAGDVGATLDRLDASSAPAAVKACIRLIAFTAVRSGEARGARVEEFSLDGAPVWVIPGSRMKRGAEHRVPLSIEAARIVRERIEAVGDGLLFPSTTGRELASSVMIRGWHKASDTDIHGLRTSFRTWAAEQPGVSPDVAESCLAHAVGSTVERSYSRSDLCERRRALMNAWAAHILGS